MKTLYDVIGARPGDDAENLKKAYRQAAKANHPDHHAGDPDAALRFKRIAAAYDVLRDADQRAAYDEMLERRRRPVDAKLKRAASEWKRHVVYDSVVAAAVTLVLIGGYALYSRTSSMPAVAGGTASGVTESGPAKVAAVAPAAGQNGERIRTSAPQMPIVVPVAPDTGVSAANDRAQEETKGESVPDAAPPVAAKADDDAKGKDAARNDDSDGRLARPGPDAMGAVGESANDNRPATPDGDKAPSVEAPLSGREPHSSGARGSWSHVVSRAATSGDRRDARVSDNRMSDTRAAESRAPDMKTPEIAGVDSGDGRPAVTKHQAASRSAIEQAVAERRTPAPGDVPPMSGGGL